MTRKEKQFEYAREWRKAHPDYGKSIEYRLRRSERTRKRYAEDAEYREHIRTQNAKYRDKKQKNKKKRARCDVQELSEIRNCILNSDFKVSEISQITRVSIDVIYRIRRGDSVSNETLLRLNMLKRLKI